jgi:hypothetical protein
MLLRGVDVESPKSPLRYRGSLAMARISFVVSSGVQKQPLLNLAFVTLLGGQLLPGLCDILYGRTEAKPPFLRACRPCMNQCECMF